MPSTILISTAASSKWIKGLLIYTMRMRSDYKACCKHKNNDCFKKGKYYKHWTMPASQLFFSVTMKPPGD
jgi:hypothetical protein